MPGNHAVFYIHSTGKSQSARWHVATTLMGHHHLGTYIPVFGVRSIALDGVELWKRLKAVLAEKAGFLAVIIRNGCFTMPDTPIVAVPRQ